MKSFFQKLKEFFSNLAEKTRPARQKTWKVLCIIGRYIKKTCSFIYRFRAIFLVILTLIAAFILADYCREKLPEQVGIELQSDGSFAKYITRDQAVNCCLWLTVISLVFVLLSKKTLYPWLISLFTFVVPVLILVTNYLAGAI